MKMKAYFTKSFKRQFKKLPKRVHDKFYKQLSYFLKNQKHPSLRIHKINMGKSLSITMNYRAKFNYKKDGNVHFFKIGSHDEIYKRK